MKTLWLVCLVFVAAWAGAYSEVYKWVDKDGNVQYGDSPPESVASEKLDIVVETPAHSDQARAQFLRKERERAKRRAADQQAAAAAERVAAEERDANQQRCTYARKQLISLQQQLPVYRDEEGTLRTRSRYDAYEGKREYLDDAARAREIDRTNQDIAQFCENPEDTREILAAGRERAMSKRCEAVRANLKAVQRPEARSPRDTIEKAQELVERYCQNGE